MWVWLLAINAIFAAPPNLVVVTIDTLRADRLGCYGNVPSPSPHIDALAARGIVFDDAMTAAPETLPSHTTLFTGLDPRAHGVQGNADNVPVSVPFVIGSLRDAGYASAAFVSGAPVAGETGLARYFDHYDDARPHALGTPRFPHERRGMDTARQAAAWVQRVDGPFVVWVHLFDPHAPLTPLDPRPGEDLYDAEIRDADAAVGHLLAALASRDEPTAIVLAADHGEALGGHGEPEHGVLLYQDTLRVPLILSVPGQAPRRESEAVGLVDVAPTLRALAGLPADGRDLREAITPRPLVAGTEYGRRRYGWAPLTAVREGAWKLIDGPVPELYDLAADPAESTNLAGKRPDLVARLTRHAHEGTDAALLSQLQALGYASTDAADVLPNPVAMVHLLEPMEQAVRALYAESFDEARKLLQPVVREDPGNPVAWNDLGMAWLGLDRHAKAAESFRKAVAISPSDAALWNNLGLAESRAGNHDEAREAYAQSAKIWPGFAAPCVNLAVLYWRGGNLDAAKRWAHEALNRAPNLPQAQEVLDRAN